MTMDKILLVIPARGGSKGIPRKNLRPVCGTPLVARAVEIARRVEGVARVVVSTEDEEIARVAREAGADLPFLRPDELAHDKATLAFVMAHALAHFDDLDQRFDAVMSLVPTAPVVRPETLSAMVATFVRSEAEAMATVSPMRQHPCMGKRISPEDGILRDYLPRPEGVTLYPRQARDTVYFMNGVSFIRARRLLERPDPTTNSLGRTPRGFVINEREAVNIDDEMDLRLAGLLLEERIREEPCGFGTQQPRAQENSICF